MLATARRLAAAQGLHHTAFEQGDAQVHPLPTAGFDTALSRFGTMFFQDPVHAFANIARALRPGGRLAFVCMADPQRTEWVRVFDAVRAALALPPQDDTAPQGPGMFSLRDPALIHRTLAAAGFTAVRTEAVDATGHFGHDAADAADHLLGSGPGRHLAAQLDPLGPLDGGDATGRARAAFTAALARHEHPDGIRLRTAAWLVTATRG